VKALHKIQISAPLVMNLETLTLVSVINDFCMSPSLLRTFASFAISVHETNKKLSYHRERERRIGRINAK